MERDKALHILNALAEGIDPASGEQFSEDSPYQRADTVRALYSAIQVLQGATSQPGATPAQPPAVKPQPEKPARPRAERANAGRPWTPEEEAQLGQAFDSGRSIDELAQAHQRSRWAIEARLAKLGKIPEPPAGLRFLIGRSAASERRAAYLPG